MAQTGVRATICAQFPFLASPSGNGTIFYSSIHLPGLSPFKSIFQQHRPSLNRSSSPSAGQNTAFAAAKDLSSDLMTGPFLFSLFRPAPAGTAVRSVCNISDGNTLKFVLIIGILILNISITSNEGWCRHGCTKTRLRTFL